MTPYAWRTFKIVIGIILVAWVAVSVVFMTMPQLFQISYHTVAMSTGATVGWLAILAFGIYLIAKSDNGNRRRQ